MSIYFIVNKSMRLKPPLTFGKDGHSIQFENYPLDTTEYKKPQGLLCGGAFTYLPKVFEQRELQYLKNLNVPGHPEVRSDLLIIQSRSLDLGPHAMIPLMRIVSAPIYHEHREHEDENHHSG